MSHKLLISVFFLVLIILALTPLSFMLWESFHINDNISFENYKDLLGERSWTLAINSIVIAVLTSILASLLGFCTALSLRMVPKSNLLWILLMTPFFIPPYIHALGWSQLLGKCGRVNQWIHSILSLPPLNIYTRPGVIMILTLSYFPLSLFIIKIGLDKLDRHWIEAGRLYARPAKVFLNITMPLLMPRLAISLLFIFILSLGEFGVPNLLQCQTYMVEVFIQFGAYHDFGKAGAISIPAVALSLFCLTLIFIIEGKDRAPRISAQFSHEIQTTNKNWYVPLVIILLLSLVFISVVAPISGLFEGLDNFSRFNIIVEEASDEIANSINFSFWAACGITFFAGFVGYLAARGGKSGRLLEALAFLPFAFPPTIFAIGLILFLNRPGIMGEVYDSYILVIWGYTIRFLPLPMRIMTSVFRGIDRKFEEAARITGAGRSKVALKILFPLVATDLLGVWLLGFIFSFQDLGMACLLNPPGSSTLPVRIFGILHTGSVATVAALALVSIGIIIVFLAIYSLLTQRILKVV